MRRFVPRFSAAFTLGLVLVAIPVLADDSKTSGESPPKAPDFSGYAYVTDVVGEVVRSDDKSVTLRVKWYQPQSKNNNNNRPRLGQNTRRPNQPQVQWKEQHHDYVLEYLPQSLVRSKSLPAKTDDKGKKVPHTQKELEELRLPVGVPNYAASKFELTPGTIVEVVLVRDRAVPAAKAVEDDLRIKYAIILGHDPNPPKDAGNAKNAKDKKNN